MHFLFWTKGSHQIPNFDTFKCSGENLLNYSLCHFPNQKSVFFQTLHHSSVSCKITPLYFFRSNVIYFAQKKTNKVQIFESFESRVKILQILDIFQTTNFQILHYLLVPWHHFQLKFYIHSMKEVYQSTNLVKFHVSSQKTEILNFDGLLLFKSYKVSAKKVQKSHLS